MKRVLVPVFFTAALLVSMSCQLPVDSPKKSIVVTYSVLGSIVKELVGDQAAVTVSVPNGADPHEWAPSARDIEAIYKADLLVRNGLGLEEGLADTLAEAERRGVKIFTVTDHITVRHIGPGEGSHEHEGEHEHEEGAPDPHLWTDPLTLKAAVAALAESIKANVGIDVTSKAAGLENRLEALSSGIASTLSAVPQSDRKLVTGHLSMGYFAQRYGFTLVGVILPSLSSQAEVSASDLAALKQEIRENQVKAIFTELGTSPIIAEAISRETGVKVVELGSHALPADGSYFTFMAGLAETISGALN